MLKRLREILRPRLSRALPSQGLVEFGLIVAGVAVAGMVGLSVLGDAEKAYFTNILPASDSGLAVAGTAPTVTITGCSAVEVRVTQDPTTCTIVATDTQGGAPPHGQIKLNVPSAPTCNLTATSSSSSTCPITNYKPTVADAPNAANGTPWAPQTLNVVAVYVPDAGDNGKHLAAASGPLMLTVDPYVNVVAGCPAAEIGNPSLCTVTVWNMAPTPPTYASSLDIRWSTVDYDDSSEPGVGCWMQINASSPPACTWLNPSHKSLEQSDCVTNGSGQCQLVYRRGYDPNYGAVGSHAIVLWPSYCGVMKAGTCFSLSQASTTLSTALAYPPHGVVLANFTCADTGSNPVPVLVVGRTITVLTGGSHVTVSLNCSAIFQDDSQASDPITEANPVLNAEFAPSCFKDPSETSVADDSYSPTLPLYQCAKFYSTFADDGGVYYTYTKFNTLTPDSYRTALMSRRIYLTADQGQPAFQLWVEFFGDPNSPSAHTGAGPDPLQYNVNFI